VKRAWRLCLILSLLLATILTFYALHLIKQPYQGYDEGIVVHIIPGSSSQEIVDLLFEHGVLAHRHLSLGYLYVSSHFGLLQAGEYEFAEALNLKEVFAKLSGGEIRLHRFTVPEGLILLEIADLWEKEEFGSAKEFIDAAAAALPLVREIDDAAISIEGYLFPETYSFRRGVTAEEAVAAMVQGFQEALIRLEAEIGMNDWLFGLRDTLTMASLIEREAAVADERPIISSVFHNRLRRAMLLECDPTVIYALQLNGSYRGRLLLVDLDVPSPYNTYKYPGLPPGPIANPGLDSLRAAVAPAETEFLFFVRTDHGRHKFSKTLKEHNRAVAAYRRSR